MTTLTLKIPPLLLVLIFATLMWLCQLALPLTLYDRNIAQPLMVLFVLIGGTIILTGAFAFKQAQTTVNPTKPETTTALVTNGIYQYTRNPMYLGMLCCLLGWGFYLANPMTILLILGFIFYINHFQIKPEEQMLTQLFHQEFIDYCASVRRWL
ncbi:methyltransferase family protein [Thalassotalea castellviae]|uniref:Isoprenylcysteine carboxylmethyltransferase family protein n=1 Tax=Thalassotalea castellviae TaxID=3075612 RepID=A0ABU3A413_9GAMM|nr:isoprenylcysteine carboxylmethyltransferase family protein [Thalassotalea sp. W431]MDT0603853.1 isoprenylcysteine carboxylmethyltransferase family protein [Thalassotalea sp. W431]